ncbi:hypothetical protein KBC04_03430 [Candidatus Babeliales bacterium]|nr:hypothetical protein [Candidatus Babeliales bacterium]MBP9843896.1 hypothetical protein [Candidatus Babeliales bacterium]
MKVKKLILLFLLVAPSFFYAGVVHHTLISITEQKVLGHMFKHVMTSGGAEKDEFFIDGYAVPKDNYTTEFERACRKEQEDQAMLQQEQLRARLQFADVVQVEIAAKLLNKLLHQTTQLLHRINNPALEKFFVFSNNTIESSEQLLQLKNFTQQLAPSVQKKIANNDFEGLNLLYTKLENWPTRLEKFFQETVQSAIKKSDDTVMLKELLKLVSELS